MSCQWHIRPYIKKFNNWDWYR